MFVIPLRALRFYSEKIKAGLRNHDPFFRADLGRGLEVESKAAFRR